MKQIYYALMAFCAFGLLSCRKSKNDFTIKQFDADQIQNYIKANGLTGMIRDTSGGDTTGIYYQILNAGTGSVINYADKISFVYSFKTVDGNFSSADTISNHANTYTAYVAPAGLQLALKNIAKRKGTKIRILIPSRLAYGINGTTISAYNSSGVVVTGTIGGNQCLDYTINLINDDVIKAGNAKTYQARYDSISILKYIAANNLTGYLPATTKSGYTYYYKITQAGTGTDVIGPNSVVGVQYTGTLLNGRIIDQANTTDGTAGATLYGLFDYQTSWQEALPKVTAGAKLSFISPSALDFGQSSSTNSVTGSVVPAFSCLRYDFNIISVIN